MHLQHFIAPERANWRSAGRTHRKAGARYDECMILEIALLNIVPERAAEFEAAYTKAYQVIKRAPGCGAVSLQRSIETPGRYVLHVEWPTVAHHMEGFRLSPLFQEWRGLLGPYFSGAPVVEHHELVPFEARR